MRKPTQASSPIHVSGRQTRPTYRDGISRVGSRSLAAGGMGAVPLALSGEDFAWLQCIAKQGISAIRACYSKDWRRLLRILTYVHELGGLAIENDATLCDFGEDAQLVVTRSGQDSQDDELTTLLTAYFASYPHGGLQGLGSALVAAADTDGIAGVEIVPTPDATDAALPPILVDGLSLRFHEDQQGRLELQQKQSATLLGTGGVWQTLDTTSVFVRGWRSSDNNLLGLPRFSRFLRVGLPDIWEQLMLSDWVQTQAYGRIAGEMDIQQAWEAIKNGADSSGVNSPSYRRGGQRHLSLCRSGKHHRRCQGQL